MKIKSTSLTVNELLNDGNTYAVPIFQRSYSWEKQQAEDFFSDLVNLYESSDKENDHFIGSMVFTPQEDSEKITVLDGQQRFATILLFLAALRDVLTERTVQGAPEWIDEIGRITYKRDIPSLSRNPKLELNRNDKVFFDKIVVEKNIPSTTDYHSHKLIRNVYGYFKEEISKKVIEHKENFVKGILDSLLNRLLMIKIEADSDVDAHMIFETLNDRGLELSVADLVKNYILSKSSANLEDAIEIWRQIVDQIEDYNVTTFLRHLWISIHEVVKKEELYKKIKNAVKETNVKEFLEQLSEEAAVYANLNNPTHQFWEDTEIEQLIDDLNVLKVEQVYSLLLAIYKSKKISLKTILPMLINFTFRYSTISRRNPNILESRYSNLAIKVRNDQIDEATLIAEIRKLSPPKEEFIARFMDTDIRGSKQAKYILFEINNYLLKKEGRKEVTTNRKDVNLEHIIPQKPNKEWKKFFKDNKINEEELIYKLGNLTILLEKFNRQSSNKFFAEKQEIYKKSELPLNDGLKKYSMFGPNEVKERQKMMADIAEELWRV